MRSTKPQAVAAAVFSFITLACGAGPATGPDSMNQFQPEFNFTNGPPVLPNVIRFESGIGGGFIADPETDLLVFAGLPEDPADAVDCGGTELGDLGAFQIVGGQGQAEAIKVLAKADVHLHVYQLSTFVDFCTSAPIATGTGRLTVNDNDAAVSGTRVNSFGASITGSVAVATGGAARLSAYIRSLIYPDGTQVVVANAVRLSSM